MKSFIVDSNFWLRFLLKDNPAQLKEVRKYIKKANEGKVELILMSEVVMEMAYVLEKLYSVPREEISRQVGGLVKSSYISVRNRAVLQGVFELISKVKLDFVDILLYVEAEEENTEILTFDRELKKLKSKYN